MMFARLRCTLPHSQSTLVGRRLYTNGADGPVHPVITMLMKTSKEKALTHPLIPVRVFKFVCAFLCLVFLRFPSPSQSVFIDSMSGPCLCVSTTGVQNSFLKRLSWLSLSGASRASGV
jgi:hypothetical protein